MTNPYQKYQQQSVQTMTQGELLVKLYETCSKRMNAGVYFIDEEKDYDKANENLQKAQKILNHLNATLDRKYEISQNLSALYDYFIRVLVEANIKKKTDTLKEIIPMIDGLGQSFKEAEKIVHRQNC